LKPDKAITCYYYFAPGPLLFRLFRSFRSSSGIFWEPILHSGPELLSSENRDNWSDFHLFAVFVHFIANEKRNFLRFAEILIFRDMKIRDLSSFGYFSIDVRHLRI